MNRVILIIVALSALLSVLQPGCQSDHKHQNVDFSQRVTVQNAGEPKIVEKKAPLNVVISSIYSAQESFSHYNDLFAYIARQCSLSVKITYCKNSREAYRLFADGTADVGVLGTANFIIGKKNHLFKILVVPVINGKTTFQSYIIVHDPSHIQTFEDLRDKLFAFTDQLSLTGYLYALSLSPDGLRFWKKTVFAGSHDNAIDLVDREIVDGASVASNVFEDIRRNNPEKTEHVRVIERSEDFGIPPIVIRQAAPAALERSLRNAFVSLKSESAGWELLQVLGIDTFIVADDSLYASARKFVAETIVP